MTSKTLSPPDHLENISSNGGEKPVIYLGLTSLLSDLKDGIVGLDIFNNNNWYIVSGDSSQDYLERINGFHQESGFLESIITIQRSLEEMRRSGRIFYKGPGFHDSITKALKYDREIALENIPSPGGTTHFWKDLRDALKPYADVRG